METEAAIYWGLKDVEYALHDYKLALDWGDKFHHLSDSIAYLHLEANAIKAEKDYKAKKLLYENNKLQKERQDIFSLIAILAFMFATGICIYQRRLLYKNKKLKFQQEEISEYRKEQIELNKKVLQGNEVTQKINLLSQIPSHKRKSLEEKMEEIFNRGPEMQEEDWKELEEILNRTQNDFASKLRNKYPKLSEKDIRCILLIRIGLDNLSLSNIFNISKESARTKRYRIRKKLGLKENVNLDHYIKRLFC